MTTVGTMIELAIVDLVSFSNEEEVRIRAHAPLLEEAKRREGRRLRDVSTLSMINLTIQVSSQRFIKS